MLQTTFNRRMLPISSAQFFSSFNEYAIKTIALLIVCGSMTNSIANGVWVLLFTVLMQVLPILLIVPAGFLGDRFPKRYITLLALILEFIVLLCGLSVIGAEGCGMTALLILLAVYSLSGAFFAPALNGLLPETFHAGMEDIKEQIAKELADFMRKRIPKHLINEYPIYAQLVAGSEITSGIMEACMDEGLLCRPKNRLGAEGMLMVVER